MEKGKQPKSIFAIKIGEKKDVQSQVKQQEQILNPIQSMFFGLRQQLSSSLPFILVFGPTELKQQKCYGNLLQQQKSRAGIPQFSFELKQHILIDQGAILIQFPITQCQQVGNKITLSEDDFRKLKTEYRTIMNMNQEEDSIVDSSNFNHQNSNDNQHNYYETGGEQGSSDQLDDIYSRRRYMGRTRSIVEGGMRTFKEHSSSEEDSNSQKKTQKRGRGRPKGSKNKKKHESQMQLEFDMKKIFMAFVNCKNRQQINRKLNKNKFGQNKSIKKDQAQQKRGRGRPKGVKNRPKNNNQQSFSEENLANDELPERKTTSQISQFPKCCSRCVQRQIKKSLFQGKSQIPAQIQTRNLVNIGQNIGVQDLSNLIIKSIKTNQKDKLRQLLQCKDNRVHTFIVGWDTIQRLQRTKYGVRTKKLFISKNFKQGINALLHDCLPVDQCWWKALTVQRILNNLPNTNASIQIYQILIENQPDLKLEIMANLPSLIRVGNDVLSSYLLKKIIDDEQLNSVFGYSKQHLQCLNSQKNQIPFKKSIMLKQNCTVNFLSPIHCAAINKNGQILNYILKHISQFSVGDSLNRKPIHYAATLQNVKNFDLLAKSGADIMDLDKKKMTPLMVAAMHGRTSIVKYILEKTKDSQYINFRGQQGYSAFHYAVLYSQQECVSIFLSDVLVNKNLQTKEGMNALHLAAGTGNCELIRMLIDKGIELGLDTFRRSPFMIAIRNHHNDIFFTLLNAGFKYYKKDLSNNTLLHYAAAYGNLEMVAYLQSFMPQLPNKKQLYPWEIAVLKGHYQCAKLLENNDLSYRQHLLQRLFKSPRGHPHFMTIVRYVLETKLYDVNYRNPVNGNTCLHLIASIGQQQYNNLRKKEFSNVPADQFQIMQKELISLLLSKGADPSIQNQKQQKPVILCIQNQNLIGIQLLLQQIPFFSNPHSHLPPSKKNHFVYYLGNLASKGKHQLGFVWHKLIQVDQRVLRSQLSKPDLHGFQFLVYLIKKFTQTVHQNFINYFSLFLRDDLYPIRYDQWVQNGNNPLQLKRNRAFVWAFLEFLQYEDMLINMITFLIEMGSDPNAIVLEPKIDKQFQNYRNWGIQHFMMKFPSLRLLKIFMKWNRNFSLQNCQGRTPLHLFCMWIRQGSLFSTSNIQGVQLPVIDIKRIIYSIPFMMLNAHQVNRFNEIKDYDGEICLQFLLQNGLSPNVLDINRSLPLLYAALNGQANFIILLRRFGSSINNCNNINQVPLFEIAKMKDKYTISQIQEFIRIGADPSFEDLNKRNILHHLVSSAKNFDHAPEICKLMFQKGVRINSLDRFNRTPIFYCFIRIDAEQLKAIPPQEHKSNNDKVQILQALLNHKEIDLNILDVYQRTPLHYACERNYFFSILYLLDKNINYDVPDAEGNTPLAVCLRYKNLNQAAMLIKKGVKYGHVFDNGNKFSYFSYAINKLSVGICFMLIDYGYPLQKALQEVPNQAFKKVLTKRYVSN